MCGFLYLAPFAPHRVWQVPPCCNVHPTVIPLGLRETRCVRPTAWLRHGSPHVGSRAAGCFLCLSSPSSVAGSVHSRTRSRAGRGAQLSETLGPSRQAVALCRPVRGAAGLSRTTAGPSLVPAVNVGAYSSPHSRRQLLFLPCLLAFSLFG